MLISPAPRILLLGDTIEADALAELLRRRDDCDLLTSSDLDAAATAGLASVSGLADMLRDQDIRLIINAANPYDADLSDRALAASVAVNLPILRLMRPAWKRDPLDSWIDVASVSAAADICRWYGKRILLTLSESDLSSFAGNDRCHFIVRLPQKPATSLDLAHHDLIVGRGPFAWLEERRLMMEQHIDLLVSRNIGGLESYAKIDVARDLAIPVVMITRPTATLQASVENIDQAQTWLDAWRQAEAGQMLDNRRTGEQKATTTESE
jgi:precorrin-6A/cobalt-precorrin-6A reductase